MTEQHTTRARCVRAPNPGPMTLDGTNTWVLAELGAGAAVVVDPGPLDEGHLRRVAEAARDVALILLTHRHDDHTAGAARFAELTGAPVRASDPAYATGGVLADGDVITVGGLEIRVVATPGHTADSCCLHLPADRAVLTGDTVLGRGTTVIAPPDGSLGAYLDTLARLRALSVTEDVRVLLPGHGPALTDPVGVLDAYARHRQERLNQIRAAAAAGHRTAEAIVRAVYTDIAPESRPAAEQSAEAQLAYLRARGEV